MTQGGSGQSTRSSPGLLNISGKIRRDRPIRRPGFSSSCIACPMRSLSDVGRIQGDLTALEGPNDTRVDPRDQSIVID